jgi:hypothetical protein
MLILIIPLAFVEESVPMFNGLANEPAASDNWAVKIFPELIVPVNE